MLNIAKSNVYTIQVYIYIHICMQYTRISNHFSSTLSTPTAQDDWNNMKQTVDMFGPLLFLFFCEGKGTISTIKFAKYLLLKNLVALLRSLSLMEASVSLSSDAPPTKSCTAKITKRRSQAFHSVSATLTLSPRHGLVPYWWKKRIAGVDEALTCYWSGKVWNKKQTVALKKLCF